MLRIRPEQIVALRRRADEDFEPRVLAHVRRRYPEAAATHEPGALAAFVRRQLERAAAYGLASERDRARFVVLALLLGEAFDEDETLGFAAATLRDASLRPDDRMALVWLDAREHLARQREPAADAPAEGAGA